MWGSNSKGELGNGEAGESILVPKRVEFFNDNMLVLDVSCGQSVTHPHTLAISQEADVRKVWSWGDNYKNQLGVDISCTDFACFPLEIVSFEEKLVTKVVAGGIHSMALCEGSVYTWGCGSDGRLGHKECAGHRYLYKEAFPRQIKSKKVVTDISCSYYHCACIAAEVAENGK